MASEGIRLLDFMVGIHDPRVTGRTDHDLVDILVLALCAVMAGAEGWDDIEDWGIENEAMLGRYLSLRNGIPGHDTIRRVFEVLEPKEVERCFAQWVSQVCPAMEGRVIAIDGKSVRGSGSVARAVKPLHLVSAYATEVGMVLRQQRCEEKSNEITAIEALLPHLALKGAVAGAIILRVALTAFAVTLLAIPYLKIIGGLLLLWIGTKLIIPDEDDDGHEIDASTTLIGAIKTIIIADFVMSLDNVIAVAAAAKDSIALIIFGLLVSIPIIVWCSQLILKLMDRYPVIITAGGALLGYIAGDMMVRDPAVIDWFKDNAAWLQTFHIAGVIGAIAVVAIGKVVVLRRPVSSEAAP